MSIDSLTLCTLLADHLDALHNGEASLSLCMAIIEDVEARASSRVEQHWVSIDGRLQTITTHKAA